MPRSQITLTSLTGSYVNEVDDVFVNGNNISLSGSLILTGTLLSSGQAAFFGNDSGIDSPTDKGADVFFYVSGSSGSAGGNVPGVAVFGGDVRVSGSLLVGAGTTIIDQQGIRTSNVSGPSITFEGNRIKFKDVDRPGGRTLDQLTDIGLEKDDNDHTIKSSRGMRLSGSLIMSGAMISNLGISGSLTKLADGSDYLVAGSHIRILTQSNGSIRLQLSPESETPGSIFFGSGEELASSSYLTFNNSTKMLSSDKMFLTGNLYSSAIIKKIEKVDVPTGGTNVDINQGEVWVFENPTGNLGVNFTNVPTIGDRMVSMTIAVIQGATPRSITSAQVNGGAVTIKWKGGSAPSPSANEVSQYRFDILRIGSSWLVLGWSDPFSS